MASLEAIPGARALLLGALLSGAGPRNLVLTASAAATSIVEAGMHDTAGRRRTAPAGEQREHSYASCRLRTISEIQTGANGDVQPGEVG